MIWREFATNSMLTKMMTQTQSFTLACHIRPHIYQNRIAIELTAYAKERPIRDTAEQ